MPPRTPTARAQKDGSGGEASPAKRARSKSPARASTPVRAKSPSRPKSPSNRREAKPSPVKPRSKSPSKPSPSKEPAKEASRSPAKRRPKAMPPAPAQAAADSKAQLEAKVKALAAAREEIGLLSCPLRTLHLFVQISSKLLLQGLAAAATSRAMKYCGYWLILAYAATHILSPELYSPPPKAGAPGGKLYMLELCLYEAVWWVVLGILSSVGFGTGLHSGIMFLWPHTMSVVLKAQEDCVGTNFNAMYNHPYNLHCYSRDDGTLTFLNQLLLLLPSVVLWGIGTAIGELPPYFVTRAARRAGGQATDLEAELQEAKQKTDLVSRLKVWTIDFTQHYGFLGVYLLASWPNAAFDMCGMACGAVDMPFWTFFGATCLGKGFTKVTLQAIVCINVFGKGLFDSLIAAVKMIPYIGDGVATNCVAGRKAIMYKFTLQERKDVASFFADKTFVTKETLVEKYCSIQSYCSGQDANEKKAEVVEMVNRVFAHLDKDSSGDLSATEFKVAESLSDGKFSLASLDPGTGSFFSLGNLWNGIIISLVIYFFISIVNQMAKSKQAELDEAELAREEKPLKGDAAHVE
mmetsp:Transcript_12749/g.31839  ORF Transcript_12749/g.31839 Transcript_12749/m.31839 type:complete len:578 (-) Transcript_12749:584-2317(-)